MRTTLLAAALVLAAASWPALAGEADDGGTLNPDEMTLDRSFQMAKRGKVGMVVCAQGYLMTKKGSHAEARAVFEACSKAGYTGAMTWMSYMETNGFGGPEDAKRAAEWDRKAAEAGDPIGTLNYGLDLLRGHGVERDPAKARDYIDRAAKAGVKDAIAVQRSGYDAETVTPDADSWRYRKRYY